MGEKTNAEIQQEAQVWRAEVDGGPGMPIYVADESDPDLPYFRAWGDGWMGYVAADTPRAAAAKVAAHARGLPVVSILAPGQRPRTELERELDHLRAAVRALAGLGDGALDAVTPDEALCAVEEHGAGEVDAEVVGALVAAAKRLKRVARERDEAEALVLRQATLLLRTADALKGPPPPLTQHSAHDLPEVAAALRTEVQGLRAQLAETEAEARRALDALHRRLDAAEAVVAAVRREHNARVAWLGSLPPGSCASPPSEQLLAAEAATRAALREVP